MRMLVVEGTWLRVRFILSIINSRSMTYSQRVDIELGVQSFRSTPTSLEALEREELTASSSPSANQVGEVPESEQMSASVQHAELQPTLPITVDL